MKPLVPLFALAALAACAPKAPPDPGAAAVRGPRQCFYAQNVTSYREAGDDAVHLRVGVKQIWRMEFAGSCPDVRWSFARIGLQQRGSGGSICGGFDVDVITDDLGFPRRCPVRTVRRLSDAEVAALPADQRP
jgi:hypothetical protein